MSRFRMRNMSFYDNPGEFPDHTRGRGLEVHIGTSDLLLSLRAPVHVFMTRPGKTRILSWLHSNCRSSFSREEVNLTPIIPVYRRNDSLSPYPNARIAYRYPEYPCTHLVYVWLLSCSTVHTDSRRGVYTASKAVSRFQRSFLIRKFILGALRSLSLDSGSDIEIRGN